MPSNIGVGAGASGFGRAGCMPINVGVHAFEHRSGCRRLHDSGHRGLLTSSTGARALCYRSNTPRSPPPLRTPAPLLTLVT
eukprot:353531-Chlamydomonas_euryale.AAC.1